MTEEQQRNLLLSREREAKMSHEERFPHRPLIGINLANGGGVAGHAIAVKYDVKREF